MGSMCNMYLLKFIFAARHKYRSHRKQDHRNLLWSTKFLSLNHSGIAGNVSVVDGWG